MFRNLTLETAQEAHIQVLEGWFQDPESCTAWGGPEFRFPFTPETFREDLRLTVLPSHALVSAAGDLLGFGQYYLRSGRCHLGRLAIAPHCRGMGVGSHLIRHLATLGCQRLGVEECSLFVLETNIAALRLYLRLGFAPAPSPEPDPRLAGCLYLWAPLSRVLAT